MSPARSRIAIVEDHTLLAESVGLALSAEGLEVGVADLSDETAVLASISPDSSLLVLLDLDLGAPIVDGASLVPSMTAAGARVLVVTGVADPLRIAAALEAGAIGYVEKNAPFEVLLDTVLRAAAGEQVMADNDRQTMLASLRRHRSARREELAPFSSLTPRERAVLAKLTAGQSVEAIAADWVVSSATVRTQVRAVLTKLGVRSQLAAVAKARAAGWSSEHEAR